MAAPNIPGFRYDTEKKRYFKILPHHLAPVRTNYVPANMHRSRRKRNKGPREGVQRRNILSNTEIGGVLSVEQARCLYGTTQQLSSALWLRNLERSSVYIGESSITWLEAWERRAVPLAQAEQRSAIFFASQGEVLTLKFADIASPLFSVWNTLRGETKIAPRIKELEKLLIWRKDIASLDYFDWSERLFLLSTDGGCAIIDLEYVDGCGFESNYHTFPRHPLCEGEYFQCRSNYDAAAPALAMTATAGIFVADLIVNEVSWRSLLNVKISATQYKSVFEDPSDALSVEWLTPKVLSGGHRNGLINLSDLRSKDNGLRLRHPSAVTNLRRINEHTLIAAGTEDSLRIYDLRWTGRPTADRQPSGHTVSFPGYRNRANIFSAMDISLGLGLVAGSMDGGCLGVFDLWTGEERQSSLEWKQRAYAQGRSPVRSVLFTRDNFSWDSKRKAGPGLVVSTEDTVQEWMM